MNYDNKLKAAERLLEVMDTLRAKCPWDREQTFESLRNNTIEETYELVDAIADHNMEGIREAFNLIHFCSGLRQTRTVLRQMYLSSRGVKRRRISSPIPTKRRFFLPLVV